MGLQNGALRNGGLRNLTELSVIPGSAVLHWRMDEGSGSTVGDDIGTNDGTLNGGTWGANSDFVGGQVISLDGIDDDIVADNNGTAIGYGTDWSVGITLDKGSSLSGEQMVWSWSDGTNAFGVWHENGNLTAAAFNGSYTAFATHPEPSAPYTARLFTTWDSSAETIELYLNDIASPNSVSSSLFFLTSNLVVGVQQDRSGRFLNGSVDDFITFSEIEDATDDYNRQPWS